VISDVELVQILKDGVLLVPKTELISHGVSVKMDGMIAVMLNVMLVMKIVLNVFITMKHTKSPVLNVLTDMSTHQSVQSLNQVSNPPKLKTLLLDLSKLLPVAIVVIPVLNTETIVKFVVLTDLTHHIVVVSMDIIKMLCYQLVLNVDYVTINV
jgi:hypothetical protein